MWLGKLTALDMTPLGWLGRKTSTLGRKTSTQTNKPHVSNVCTNAKRTFGFLRRNLLSCSQDMKEMAYRGLVRPILEYASPVWDPRGIVVQEELEKIQNRAARFVTGNYNFETGNITSILEQLGWESLHKRRNKLILLFQGLKGRATCSVPCSNLQPPNKQSRNPHPMAFQVLYAKTVQFLPRHH